MALFTQRVEIVTEYNERRDCADQRVPEFLWACGFVPVPLPNNEKYIEEIVESVSPKLIVLTGGNSLVRYGGNAPERDAADKKLLDIAINKRIPLYGFCRGMQSILDYYGNELEAVSGHVALTHYITGNIEGEVNSYHNQGCVKLINDELEIMAKSEDGVIEAIRHRCYPIYGTMWHPERENPFSDRDKEILQHLVIPPICKGEG
ncbi:MAG: gamma-glutamyl-gamma-aminobutyrate hydrolase family protein [Lachnospiraceae bacterium]|nr:gamma-glutamyl-gamma-aminobutyrate hydrolase family protein [Lachnospiraceae bacterium]